MEAVKFLLAAGANTQIRSKAGDTALALAKRRSRAAVMNVLLEHEAKK